MRAGPGSGSSARRRSCRTSTAWCSVPGSAGAARVVRAGAPATIGAAMVEPRFDSAAATSEARRALHEQNRLSWNEATRAHNSHKADQARFFREGRNTLAPEETSLLGDLTGMSVVHLQCNSGQDTLSITRLGATR